MNSLHVALRMPNVGIVRHLAIVSVLILGCGPKPLQKHPHREPRPATNDLRCEPSRSDGGGLLWDPTFPRGMDGDPNTGAGTGGGGGGTSDRRCQQHVMLTVRAFEAATSGDCVTLANTDAEVCSIDPVFLANVYVSRIDGASCRQRADVIRQCANGAGLQPR